MQLQLAAESHVPCFQERVGTSIPGYMIPDRLPWRPRARPSATLHEIGSTQRMNVRRTCSVIVQNRSVGSQAKLEAKHISHEA